MKNLLLLTAVLTAFFGFSQSYQSGPYYLSELIVSPGGADRPNEYLEIRGTANSTIADDLWLIVIEGDGESGKTDMGEVKESINLKGLTFGSNGYLVIVADITGSDPAPIGTGLGVGFNQNPYQTLLDASNANVVLVELTGDPEEQGAVGSETLRRFNNVAIVSNDIGFDGNLNDQASTYMLINSATDPKGLDVDGVVGAHDGEFDATGDHTSWIIYDSYSVLDNDDFVGSDQGEFGYGQIIFAEDYTGNEANFFFPAGTPVFSVNNDSQYVARQGTSTGYTQNDWIATRINSGTAPNWRFGSSAADSSPQDFAGFTLPDSTIGGENLSLITLSITEQELTADISFYPNPTSHVININSKGDIISSIEVVDVTGKILVQKENNLDMIDLSSFSNGLYYMNVYGDGAKVTKAIVKK